MYPGYLDKLLMGKEDIQRRTEYSPNNHFMYWVDKRSRSERQRAAHKIREMRQHGQDDAHGGFGRGDQVSSIYTFVTIYMSLYVSIKVANILPSTST
jgi:hypothetical protein